LQEVASLVRGGLDWERLFRAADDEGLLPLLYWNLRDVGEGIPPDTLRRLKAHYLGILSRNLRLGRELEPFFREVYASGLKVVLTKGLRLASTIYPDLGLRPFWDVDLVVAPPDWPAIRQVLQRLDFRETPAPDSGQAAVPGPGWLYSPYFQRGDLILEFHFNPFGLHYSVPRLVAGEMATEALAIGRAEVAVFPLEHELCYLCLHAQQHSYQRLVWLSDIGRLASRANMRWDEVGRVCETFKVRASVHHALTLVNDLWPGTVSREVAALLRPTFLAERALTFLWPSTSVAARRAITWPYYMPSLFSLWERRSPGLAARTLGAILFPPRPWLARTTGAPPDSLGLYVQYLRRLSRPVGLVLRRFVDII
jgi:hypothetical protein